MKVRDCPCCKGEGTVVVRLAVDDSGTLVEECPRCKGTGRERA